MSTHLFIRYPKLYFSTLGDLNICIMNYNITSHKVYNKCYNTMSICCYNDYQYKNENLQNICIL